MPNEFNLLSDLLSNRSFVRWVEGEAGKKEALFWDRWTRKNEINRKLALEAQARIVGVKSTWADFSDARQKWDLFSMRINELNEERSKFRRNRKFRNWWFHMAAVILVTISTGLFAYYADIQNLGMQEADNPVETEIVWKSVETDYSEQKQITLSDGSFIILGAHSSLSYPDGWFQGETIEVELEGEAYFNISKREKGQEFRVKTIDGVVEVLGTRFVVDKEVNQTRVVLEEGAVRVTSAHFNSNNEGRIVDLLPDQMAEFSHASHSLNLENVNSAVYTSWTKNQIILDNSSFGVLADRIRKAFGVKVRVNDPGLYERKLTGTLNLKSVDQLMNAVSEVLEIEVHQMDDTIVFGSI